MDRYIGRLLDNRYEILEVIGTGGMAVVYKARCHRLNRLVAIKILKDEYSKDEDFRRRFHAESHAVAMLGHPNIVQVYDVSSTGEADYIVMELIDGITLKQYMGKKGVLNWKETLHFGMQIAKALEHAHSRGLVHRDIKPHNVMVLKNGSVKVTDFGIAQVMSKSNTLTKEALGSVHYISPEQAKGGRVDNRSDIYSLGIVMYEMMTGRPPYDGESPVAVAIKHINGGAAMPSTLNPNIPGGLEQIIMKGMAHDPDDRYDTATAMLYDMEEFRKNPAILFPFGAGVGVDILTAAERKTPAEPVVSGAQQGRTTAERVAGVKAAEGAIRRTDAVRRSPKDAQAARRRREEQEEADRSRVATIAIVALSAVAVFAIVIFLITLINGGLFNQDPTVPVPDLLDQPYYEGIQDKYPDFQIRVEYEVNEDEKPGYIIHQEPAPNTGVNKGTLLFITVCQSEEVKQQTMTDMSGKRPEAVEATLNSLGMNLTVKRDEESHDTVQEGLVVRTEPAAGETLTEGQEVILWVSTGPEIKTYSIPNVVGKDLEAALAVLESNKITVANYKITEKEENSDTVKEGLITRTEPASGTKLKEGEEIILWVSIGPEIIKGKMPNVVGLDYSTAVEILNSEGFNNVDFVFVESEEDKDVVVSQPYPKNTKLDVTTEIILEISSGPADPTEPPTTAPTEPELVTMPVTISLPSEGLASEYILTIRYSGKEQKAVDDMKIQAGTSSVTVNLTGTGVQRYDIYINNEYYRTETVEFTANG